LPLGRRTPAQRQGAAADMRRGVRSLRMAVSKSMPILIVDDYNTMIRILRNLLRQLGFNNIDEASDGRTALAKLQSKDYALVISDWGMQPMSGGELLQRVRADARNRATPFVMITNDADSSAIAAGRAGAATYLVKPVNAQSLKAKLVSVFGAF
jgi:two-component system chemotaxis response regulator CheY